MESDFITPEEEKEYLAYHTYRDIELNLESGLSCEERVILHGCKGATLISGSMIAFVPSISLFLNEWSKKERLFLLSEVTAEHRRHTRERIEFPYICTPHLLSNDIVVERMDVPGGLKYRRVYDRKRLYRKAIKTFKSTYDVGEGYEYVWVRAAANYINILLQELKPSKIFLWNEFNAFHILFSQIAHGKHIPVYYMEYGCVPGTYTIDAQGQVGKSRVTINYRRFSKLPIMDRDLENSRRVIEYVYYKEPNRYSQPPKSIDFLFASLYNSRRKTVLFIGQYDEGSGIIPYDRVSRKYISPIFKSSVEAQAYVEHLCELNGWNFIYRPHPITCIHKRVKDPLCEANLNEIIDISDVVITIGSQVSYMALFRQKPVVMLGYNELYGKGCTYEAFNRKCIPVKIQDAIINGVTDNQWECFIRHIAQMLKYALYDDLIERDIRYGRSILKGIETEWKWE